MSNETVGYALLDMNGVDETSSFYDDSYTYSYDKYSCVRGFYFAHVVFCFLIFLSGIGCFLTRMISRLTFLHAWFGRIYILSMLWSTATSLLINNTGLPLATLVSFAAVMGGLTIGWLVIIIHKDRLNRKAETMVQEQLIAKLSEQSKSKDDNEVVTEIDVTLDLKQMHKEALTTVIDSQTFKQRYFSLKTLHGILFFVSWFQITGRIFASNLSGDFTCHTYPVYKPLDTPEGNFADENITIVPTNDPNWDRLPWSNGPVAWSLGLIFGSMAIAMIIGAVWIFVLVRLAAKRRSSTESNLSSESRKSADLRSGTEHVDVSSPMSEKLSDESDESDESPAE